MVATASFVSPLRYSRDRKQPLRERLAVDLPGTGPERLALEPDTRGQLVFRDPAGKPGAQTVLRALEAGRHRNGGPDRLEAQWVREREDYAVLDRRVGEDRLFDLFRIHLQAPVVEHLIDPPREVQAPFLTAMDHVDRGSWSYVPNSLGELTSQTNARGQTLQMTYDLLGRPLTRVEPEGTTTWTWGTQPGQYEIGRLAQVSGPGGYAEAYDYDSAGRLVQTTITADGGPYVINRDYNSAGLVDSLTYPASTGAPLRVRYGYDHGLLDRVSDYDNPATVFWQLNTMDARGQALDETLGSANPAISVLSSYDPMTGLLESRTASVGSTLRQDLSFTWDAGGNLKSRTDHIQGALTEEFFYDSLGRLDYSRRAGVQNLDLSYDAYGNIASRVEGGGSYSYQYSHGAHPHAVSAVLHDCGCSCLSDDYAYDGNGNMTSRVGSAISWSSYDLPLVLNQDGASSQFAYTPGRSRWKQVAVYSASTTETTLYLGGVMEKVTRGSVTEWKHYIPAGAGSTALHIRKSAGSPASATYYVTGDHLGSATAVMDGGGALLSQLSFAAFGSRRGSAWQDQPLAADWNVITATTRRGFTGHEHLDNLSLVHMNGRVYDPKLGRFLSADPVPGNPGDPQSLNPYSYAMNNPLTFTDPTGYSIVVALAGGPSPLSPSTSPCTEPNCMVVTGTRSGEGPTTWVSNRGVSDEVGFMLDTPIAPYEQALKDMASAYIAWAKSMRPGKTVQSSQGSPGPKPGPDPTQPSGSPSATDGSQGGDGDFGIQYAQAGDQSNPFGGDYFEVRPPDADGYLTQGEATWQWRNGQGAPVDVDLNTLDLSGVRASEFAGPGSKLLFSTAKPWDFLVHGSITLQMNPNGAVSALTNTYNFDMKPWGVQTFIRNVEAWTGARYAGPGQQFDIHFRGSVAVRP